MQAQLTILLPAAGTSARMGGTDKLLEDVHGMPALRHAACLALRLGGQVLVTLAAGHPYGAARAAALADLQVRILWLQDAHEGLSASLRAAAAATGAASDMMILLPDMPDLELADLQRVLSAFRAAPSRPARAATSGGMHGHPVILPAAMIGELGQLQGDQGAAALLRGRPVTLVALAGERARRDLDTPEDWEKWRAPGGEIGARQN